MFMVLPQNGNVSFLQQINLVNKNVNLATKPTNTSLKSSMISRIHDLKPGCGSCGRKG